MDSERKAVAFVGVGRHGRRLLDIFRGLDIDARIVLVDKDASVLRAQIAEHRGAPVETYRDKDIRSIPGVIDLCVVATPTADRAAAVLDMIANGCRSFIIEKAFANSAHELETLVESLRRHGVRAYSGLVHRRMKFWREIKACLRPGPVGIVLQANLGAVGLATDGIHLIDLFAFLTDADRLSVEAAHRYPEAIPSPRGHAYRDHGGNITFRADGTESFFNLAINPAHNAFGTLTLVADNVMVSSADLYARVLVAEDDGTARSHPVYHYGRGWTEWRPVLVDDRFAYFDLYASTMRFLIEPSGDDDELLPRFEDGLPAHKALFAALDRLSVPAERHLP